MFVSFSFRSSAYWKRAWNLKYCWPRAGGTEARMKKLYSCFRLENLPPGGLAAVEHRGIPNHPGCSICQPELIIALASAPPSKPLGHARLPPGKAPPEGY